MQYLASEPTDYGAQRRQAAVVAQIDLPGEITAREYTDGWIGDVMMRISQRFASGRVVVAQTFIPRELIDGCPSELLGSQIGLAAHRQLRPWLYPDHLVWPVFDPFPRATAAWRRLRRTVRR